MYIKFVVVVGGIHSRFNSRLSQTNIVSIRTLDNVGIYDDVSTHDDFNSEFRCAKNASRVALFAIFVQLSTRDVIPEGSWRGDVSIGID